MQDELVLRIKVFLLVLLLALTSCAMGGDIQRKYVISHVTDETLQEKDKDFKKD